MGSLFRKKQVILYLIWVTAALFTSTQLYLKSVDANGDESWIKLFAIQLLVWSIWGALSPLIFWLGENFRVDKQKPFPSVVLHLVSGVLIVLIYLSLYSLLWNVLGTGSISMETFLLYFKVFFLNLFHWHFFIYMAIIGIVHAMEYQKESKQREGESIELERQLLLTELNMLKSQLSPHFLLNTINNVISVVEQGKNEVATGMLIRLGDFLRKCLEDSKHRLIPLENEMDFIKKYLEIEQFRNQELEVAFHLEEDTKTCQVPNFILQPIIENAIKHGISKSRDAHRIEVTSVLDDDQLRLSVYNEGPGLTRELKAKTGIGLDVTTMRLAKLYGKSEYFQIFSVNDGVMVEITLPQN